MDKNMETPERVIEQPKLVVETAREDQLVKELHNIYKAIVNLTNVMNLRR